MREFTVNGQLSHVEVNGDRVEFADKYAFKASAKTAYRSNQGKGDLYPLDALLYFLRHKEKPHGSYIKSARDAGLATVVFIDRKDLLAYLTGKSDSSDNIVAASDLLPELAAAPEEQPAKRQRLDHDASAGAVGGLEDAAPGSEQAVLADLAGWEHQLRDRNSMLVVPGASFGGILTQLNTLLRDQHRLKQEQRKGGAAQGSGKARPPGKPGATASQQGGRSSGTQAGDAGRLSTGAAAQSTAPRRDEEALRPIILVPSALTALVGMWNARSLLEEGRYRSVEECKVAGEKKPSRIEFRRGIGRGPGSNSRGPGGREPVYVVTDRAPPKGHKDWNRVVAVVVQGVKWQFKDFPFKGADGGDLVETFHKLMGVHLLFHDDQVPEPVRKWNVHVLRLHRTDRHKDISVAADLFKHLDQFLMSKKSQLNY